MNVIVKATPEEWETIGKFIRETCKSWRVAKHFHAPIIQTPKQYFADRIALFDHLYGHSADASMVLGLDSEGRYAVHLIMTTEDATLLRMFHYENMEMVATA